MKRTIILSAVTLLVLSVMALLPQRNASAESPYSPPINGQITERNNCSATLEGATVVFFDRTTSTTLCTVTSGSKGWAGCTATPGHEIMITASYGGYSGCKIITMGSGGYDYGFLCIGDQCQDF